MNKPNGRLESLDKESNVEIGFMGEKLAQDILKGEEKKRLVSWIGDTGE